MTASRKSRNVLYETSNGRARVIASAAGFKVQVKVECWRTVDTTTAAYRSRALADTYARADRGTL